MFADVRRASRRLLIYGSSIARTALPISACPPAGHPLRRLLVSRLRLHGHTMLQFAALADWVPNKDFDRLFATLRGLQPAGFARHRQPRRHSVLIAPAVAWPRRAAIFTSSAIDRAPILRIIRPRCAFTVTSVIPSSPPTCLFI